MDANSQKVNDIIKSYLSDLQRHIIVNKAILYGSYAKGNYNEYSDVDIAIFSNGEKHLFGAVNPERFLFGEKAAEKEVDEGERTRN